MLITGTGLALGSTFGSAWLVRAGVLVAVLTGVAVLVLSRRRMRRMSEEHTHELAAERASSLAASQRHHRESMEMISRYSEQISTLRTTKQAQRALMNGLRSDLRDSMKLEHVLRSNNAELIETTARQRHRIAQLESSLAGQEMELARLRLSFAKRHYEAKSHVGRLVPILSRVKPTSEVG